MEKKSGKSKSGEEERPASAVQKPDEFPETQTDILRRAAEGEWTAFFHEYLRPCWREVVLACRQRGIPLANADDLLQELTLRIMREGTFSPAMRAAFRDAEKNVPGRGNLAARYLKSRDLPMSTARFRTLLKAVIRNLVLEELRSRTKDERGKRQLSERAVQQWVDESVSDTLDRKWVIACFGAAVGRLKQESRQSATKGRRWLYDVLYLTVVEQMSQAQLASQFGLERSTLSTLQSAARSRLLELLMKVTGIQHRDMLKRLVADAPDLMKDAFISAENDTTLDSDGSDKA